MKLLLDTCAISELRRPECPERVKRIIEMTRDQDLFVSAITIGELQKGITLLPTSQKKRDLESWLAAMEALYADRVLPITRETARIWGEITAKCQTAGRHLGAADGLIAASAIQHGLHVFTRNSRDFEQTGAMISDPWTE